MNNVEKISIAKFYQRQALQNILSEIKDLGDGTYSVPKRFVNGKVSECQIITESELDCYILRQMSLLRSALSETLTMQDDIDSIWQQNNKMGIPTESQNKNKELSIFNLA